jgi:hypothetical protein
MQLVNVAGAREKLCDIALSHEILVREPTEAIQPRKAAASRLLCKGRYLFDRLLR